jgi:hypothetical protein
MMSIIGRNYLYYINTKQWIVCVQRETEGKRIIRERFIRRPLSSGSSYGGYITKVTQSAEHLLVLSETLNQGLWNGYRPTCATHGEIHLIWSGYPATGWRIIRNWKLITRPTFWNTSQNSNERALPMIHTRDPLTQFPGASPGQLLEFRQTLLTAAYYNNNTPVALTDVLCAQGSSSPNLGVASVVYWLVCLPLDPRVAGSNPAEAMDF